MRTTTLIGCLIALLPLSTTACSKDEHKASPAKTETPPAPSPPPTPPPAMTPPTPSASTALPVHECPKGTAGEGTFAKPCEVAKGTARMMEVTWSGKTDDKGPHFRVVNKSDKVILFGKMAVYFYDKAGKQLEVKGDDSSGAPAKNKPYQSCSGNMFGGVMKPGEKAVLTFSCVQQKHIPEGTKAIEAEMQTVGFSDPSEKKVDYYWSNSHLTPEARPKGGVKEAK
jgi:hypothetical protein